MAVDQLCLTCFNTGCAVCGKPYKRTKSANPQATRMCGIKLPMHVYGELTELAKKAGMPTAVYGRQLLVHHLNIASGHPERND